MLYRENHFMVVSANWEAAKTLGTAAISTKPATVARFKYYAMRLHISCPFPDSRTEYPEPNEVRESFIALHSELPALVRMLQAWDMMMNGGTSAYQFEFKIQENSAAANVRVQKLLLDPFRQVSSAYLKVIIDGADAAYRKDLVSSMIIPMQWTRAVQWRLYEVLLWSFNRADETFRSGNLRLALDMYQHTMDICDGAGQNNERLTRSDDSDFRHRGLLVVIACQTNIVLLGLKDKTLRRANGGWEWLQEAASWIDFLIDPAIDPQAINLLRSKTHHFRGIAYVLQGGSRGMALDEFEKADRLLPGNKILKEHIDIIKEQRAGSTTQRILSADQIPLQPIKISDQPNQNFAPSELIATERAVLRKFGYHGDMLPQIPASEPVDKHSVEQAEARLDNLKRQSGVNHLGRPVWLSSVKLEGNGGRKVMYEY
ncbi:MAG: hypothetical protein Q9221_007448 [Calogaya cf. arnoldii]